MNKDTRLVATKMFSDMYITIGHESDVGNIIDRAFDSYLNSQNLSSIEDHKEYRKIYDKLKNGGK